MGRPEHKKLKVTMLQRDFLLEKYVRLLNETKSDEAFNQSDVARLELYV